MSSSSLKPQTEVMVLGESALANYAEYYDEWDNADTEECPDCYGSGMDRYERFECPTCYGEGEIPIVDTLLV